MFFPTTLTGAQQVRLTVKPLSCTARWGTAFRASGWRSFCKPSAKGGPLTWMLKRGASAVLITQLAESSITQVVSLPTEEAAELCSLFVSSGLAVPA